MKNIVAAVLCLLALTACTKGQSHEAHNIGEAGNSVTVKLPPARSATATTATSFKDHESDGNEEGNEFE